MNATATIVGADIEGQDQNKPVGHKWSPAHASRTAVFNLDLMPHAHGSVAACARRVPRRGNTRVIAIFRDSND